mmetsp:Transcript_7355/g.12365  ORF Transcript_7355/g.12365 Transcript_7355/m.12365 type:complete len:524 (-) Transcript_7355:138-1709(-)|eukprot:CAMPEP_0114430530 /NCGR_PEP_ID=MMETSP0103-20121206/10090_1 /TAXON_ID=37642 ORGANISM="Paraphysomonas imperforata, Strain PA2" /NCGR_SAMPLE_ID=MMETSP0103 /ASSEMBLY_ACC=CAM_ASM_000201 /LENGTH=523 /DNA_ID=CAMNT_0001599983 /DNA_START=136 /DNA_END=1707 /DNA_ORIENTATION=+
MNRIENLLSDKIKAVKAKAQHLVKNPNDLFKPQRRVIARKLRQAVTGDEKKRIRDLLKEKKKEPTNTKLFDKISFTLGVLNIPVCQFFMVSRPDLFWAWFTFIIPTLVIARYFYYTKIKMQYFLYDFCYFTNILSIMTMRSYDALPSLFRVVFIFCNGPLSWAVVIWRNSLVYHDFDRMTSIYIHLLPVLLSYCVRWYGLSAENAAVTLQVQDFVNAAVVYLFWQYLYYYKTEVKDKAFLDADKDMVTSLRYLASDKKNGMARFVLKVCRRMGIFAKDEDYNPAELKTLMVFMGTQFIYTLVTMLPVSFLFNSFLLHVGFIIFIFTCVVYNGASYYIEVFSKRYQLKFNKKEDMQKVVQAAAEVAYEATKTASSSHLSALGSSRSLSGMGTGSPAAVLRSASSSSSLGAPLLEEVSEEKKEGSTVEGETKNSTLSVDTSDVTEESEGRGELLVEGERERTESDDVRSIIQAATTLFVDEWQLANEDNIDHDDEHELDDSDSCNDSTFAESYSDDEEDEKDKDA